MTKELREQVKEKVPDSLQTKEFNLLLSLIKEHNFPTAEQLKSYVETKIGTLKIELKDKRTSTTMTDELRKIAKEADILSSIKEQFFKFL